MSKQLKHVVKEDGLTIQLLWFDFRKKHNITWVKKKTQTGKTVHIPTWPEYLTDFIRDHGINHTRVGNGQYAKTPDGRAVEMKDILFHFPSKDIAALFKLSYL